MKWKTRKFLFLRKLKKITLPGFGGVPLLTVILFFWNGLINGAITTRASAIAFNFFLALFPMILFFFSLIPYIPIEDFQAELMRLLEDMLPQNAFLAVQDTLEEIVTRQRFDLLSIGFIAALYFSTNGITSLITAFNASYHSFKERGWLSQRLIAIALVCILSTIIVSAVLLLIFSKDALNYLLEHRLISDGITYYLLLIGQWIVIMALFFSATSVLYYFAPSRRVQFRFVSAGAILASLLMILTSWGFSFYVNNFSQYNKLYGSIGTLLVILMWIYFNALVLLIGFELNISIKQAENKKREELNILA